MAGETADTLLPPAAWRQLAASYPRHVVVADANALFQDALRRATDGFTAMSFLAEQGSIALLSASHVPAKAEEHLPRIAAEAGVDETLVMETWRTVHQTLTRFVSVPASLCAKDPRVAAVRDPEDIAFAQLAVALGPSLLLTRDHHLHDAGIGTEQWVETLLILGSLVELELAFFGTTRLAFACGYVLASMATEGLRFLCRSPVALGAALGVGVVLLSRDRESLYQGAKKTRQSLAAAGSRALDLAGPHVERHLEARAHLHARLVAPMEPSPPDSICARELSVSDEGLNISDLSAVLRREGYDYSPEDLEGELVAHPSFVSNGETWTLGRLGGAPEGARRRPTEPPEARGPRRSSNRDNRRQVVR